jgi:hypothetical protein
MWVLNWLGPRPYRVEIHKLAVILGFVLRPDEFGCLDLFFQSFESCRPISAVVLGFFAVPTAT